MKKSFFAICLAFIIIMVVLFMNLKSLQNEQKEVQRFNKIYEEYNTDNLNGLDVATVINKAINNNQKYEIEKNENDEYVSDDTYSIKIYITMIINKKTYPMERIDSLGINSFVEYFGGVGFKCSDIKYHSNGRISEMTFEATEY